MDGKIVEEGSTKNLMEKYGTSSVDDLLMGVVIAKDDQPRASVLSLLFVISVFFFFFNISIVNRNYNNCIV